jgi:hypothetical protein
LTEVGEAAFLNATEAEMSVNVTGDWAVGALEARLGGSLIS